MSSHAILAETDQPTVPQVSSDNRLLARLLHLDIIPHAEGNLDDKLQQLAAMAARVSHASNCAILLCGEDEDGNPTPGICANHGHFPASLYQEAMKAAKRHHEASLTNGQALLLDDTWRGQSPKASARKPSSGDAILAPIQIEGKTIGVVNVNAPLEKNAFDETDVGLLSVIALFIGKSIQVYQLQNVLNSRFAQMALAHDANQAIGSVVLSTAQDPNQMAKIVAKSFYRELSKAGFASSQIINAATEIISQLSTSISKHSKRMTRP
jgi:L-methionine (R)-S-oxide reductase